MNYFRQNNLFTECQSGFTPEGSCVAQLLSITHKIYQSFAALVVTDAIKGTLPDHIYREISLESLAERRWSPKTFFFHKIIYGLLPVAQREISSGFSLIFQKLLIRFGMKVYFLNCSLME